MSTQVKKNWGNALSAFADKRAAIMFFLGFSAGIPILLIFSSLSLWLGEAGVDKTAVTMFSWAALGYSFKFVWAPLVDALPIPVLTKMLGRRRSWLLLAQVLIMVAIGGMAMTNPALGQQALIQMAIGAVLLGFASATQDIVIDAYRIELADTQMQTVLASTYNAGYRIGMIVAGAGALFIASGFGTAKGNYIYSAWQYTYWIMAAVMLIGVATTLLIQEPKIKREMKQYQKADYLRLVLVFACVVVGFISCFIALGAVTALISVSDPFLSFLIEACRFIASGVAAVLVGVLLVKLGAVNKQMAAETWVVPISDFFSRYGVKLALSLLLLIGFYRISDIIAGVISNVFYQDMNFTKEEIAEAVKVYGVIFSLVGGFFGGLLSQRFNIMRVMFIGAILASCTNLIFIGLVNSGTKTSAVTVTIGGFTQQVVTDEVGVWTLEVPTSVLQAAHSIETKVSTADNNGRVITRQMPYLLANGNKTVQIQWLPLTRDNMLSQQEAQEKAIVLEGQVFGIAAADLEKTTVDVMLGPDTFVAKVDKNGLFSTTVSGKQLAQAQVKTLQAQVQSPAGAVSASLNYQVGEAVLNAKLDNHIDAMPLVQADSATHTVSGKVVKQYSQLWLYFAIIMDNLAAGLAGAAFIAFLSSLTSVSFTAVQYAIFSSLMTLTPKIIGGYSGSIVNSIGYPNFFLFTTLLGVPILFLVWWVARLLKQQAEA